MKKKAIFVFIIVFFGMALMSNSAIAEFEESAEQEFDLRAEIVLQGEGDKGIIEQEAGENLKAKIETLPGGESYGKIIQTGENNIAELLNIEAGEKAKLDQSGSDNIARVKEQRIAGAISKITQRGEENEAYISQKAGGEAEIHQAENTYNNYARITQNSENSVTTAIINQGQGSRNNEAEIIQTTDSSASASIHQEGEDNKARITQTD